MVPKIEVFSFHFFMWILHLYAILHFFSFSFLWSVLSPLVAWRSSFHLWLTFAFAGKKTTSVSCQVISSYPTPNSNTLLFIGFRRWVWLFSKNIFIFLVGIFGFTTGTYASLRDIVENINKPTWAKVGQLTSNSTHDFCDHRNESNFTASLPHSVHSSDLFIEVKLYIFCRLFCENIYWQM